MSKHRCARVTLVIWLFLFVMHAVDAGCPPCPEGAACLPVPEVCACVKDTTGDPNFHCHDPSKYFYCQIAYDPAVRTYDGESATVYIPAAAAMSYIKTIRNDDRHPRELCDLKVVPWTSRLGGKFIIEGVDFFFDQSTQKRGETSSWGRIIGSIGPAPNHTEILYAWKIQFYRSGRDRFANVAFITSNGEQRYRRRISKCDSLFQRDPSDFLTVSFDCCHQTFGFRPFNPYNREKVPGVWVKARRQQLWSIGLPWYLCNEPDGDISIDDWKQRRLLTDRRLAMTMATLLQDYPVNFPGAPSQLEATKKVLLTCSKVDMKDLFEGVGFLFTDNRLVEKINSTEVLFDIFHDFSIAFCQQDDDSLERCTQATKEILEIVQENGVTPGPWVFIDMGNLCSQFINH